MQTRLSILCVLDHLIARLHNILELDIGRFGLVLRVKVHLIGAVCLVDPILLRLNLLPQAFLGDGSEAASLGIDASDELAEILGLAVSMGPWSQREGFLGS